MIDALAENTTVQNEILILGAALFTLETLCRIIIQTFETNSRPNYGAISSRTNERWVPEADAKIKTLSWEPRINIEEGIIKLLIGIKIINIYT